MRQQSYFRRLLTRSLRSIEQSPIRRNNISLGRRFEQLEDRTVPTMISNNGQTFNLFDTGTDSTGAILTTGNDIHYTVTTPSSGTIQAVLASNSSGGSGDAFGFNRGYISSTNGSSSTAGEYDYNTTFTLPTNTNMASARLSGLISSANQISGVKIDGVTQTLTTLQPPFNPLVFPLIGHANGGYPFSIDISSLSTNATHTLTFLTQQTGGFTGFKAADLVLNVQPPLNSQPPIVSGGTSSSTLGVNGPAVTIDPNLLITNTSGLPFTGASVIIGANFTSGDQLLFTNMGNITGSYNSTNGVLTFTGSDTSANYQAVLRAVQIKTTAVGGGPRDVTFSIAPGSFDSTNSRFYEFITNPGENWGRAEAQAASMSIFGMQGYLAVITSVAENNFADSKVGANLAWLGMSDASTEDFWQYATGPLAGTHFFQQTAGGNSGSPVGGLYNDWNPATPEPNNSGASGEDYAHFLANGLWNDFTETNSSPAGFVVEFGGSINDPVLQLTADTTVNILNIGSLSPSSAPVGSPDTTITLTGTGFVSGATVELNGTPITTNFISSTSLTAVIPAADLATGGSDSITVVNPDGTTSGPQTFTVQAGLEATLSGGNLTIQDTGGLPNAITVSKDGSGNYIIHDSLQTFIEIPPGATLSTDQKTLTIPSGSVTGNITVNTAAGADSLTVDYTAAGGFFTTPIIYHGGNDSGDTLLVKSGAIAKGTETYGSGGVGDTGTILLDPSGSGTTTDTITYDGVNGTAPIDLTGSPIANLTLNLPVGGAGTNAFLEDDGISGNGTSQLRNTGGTAFGTTKFHNPTTLAINPGSASDTIGVQSLPDFTAATTLGSSGAVFSTVNVNGTVALGSGGFSAFGKSITTGAASSLSAATVSLTASQNLTVSGPITATGAANLSFGQGGAGGTATISAPVNGSTASIVGGAGADSFIVNSTGTSALNLDGAGGGDSYAINYGSLGTGAAAIADSGGTGTDTATLNGTSGADTFLVNTSTARTVTVGTQSTTYTASLEQMTLDGGASGDTYDVQFANGPLPPTFTIADSGASGTDSAALFGTVNADTFGVNFSAAHAVTFGSPTTEQVNYNGNLENLSVNGPAYPGDSPPTPPLATDVGDTFQVSPDASTAIAINGGKPTSGTGDTLVLNAVGLANAVISPNPSLPSGQVASSNMKTVTWTSIETFPVPLGLGGTFDFQSPGSATQAGFLPVTPNDTTASGSYAFAHVGWVPGEAGAGSFDRTATFGAAGTAHSPADANLFSDGEWGYAGPAGGIGANANDGVFQVAVAPNQPVQVTVFAGDTYAQRDNFNVYVGNATIGFTKLNPTISTFSTNGQTYQFVSYSGVFNPGAGTNLQVEFETQNGGSSAFWTVNGVDVRPLGLIAPLSIVRADSSPVSTAVAADGLTVDYYTGTGAAPGAELTISPQFGTPVDANGTGGDGLQADADPGVAGFQVLADAAGHFAFGIQRPTGIGPSLITVEAVDGSSGVGQIPATFSNPAVLLPNPVSQVYSLPETRRIDFGPATAPIAAGYIGFGSTAYISTAANALGWLGAPPTTFDRGPSNALQEDGVFGTNPSDFELDMPDANAVYSVTVDLGDALNPQNDMFVEVVDPATGAIVQATPVSGVSTPGGQSTSSTFAVTTDAQGRIRLRFGTTDTDPNAFWTLQGLEVRPEVGLSPAPPGSQLPLSVNGIAYAGASAGTGSPFTATALPGVVLANGTTATTYSIAGALPNALLTVTSTFGTTATPFGTITTTDAGPTYTGFQVQANASGQATFSITSPFSTANDLTGTIAITDTTGAALGVFTQSYQGSQSPPPASPPTAIVQKFDFNSGTSPTLAGYTGVQPTALFTPTQGYGWQTAVNGYDRGSSSVSITPALFEDGAWGSGSGTFEVAVTKGSSRDVRVYIGDPYAPWSGITISVEGGAAPVAVDPVNDRFSYVTLTGTDLNDDGILDIAINGGIWVASGMDVATPGNLPAASSPPPVVPPPPPPPPGPNNLTPTGVRLDFNGPSVDTAPGFTSVRASQAFSPAVGYGWQTSVSEFERAASSLPGTLTAAEQSLYRDGDFGTTSATFALAVTPGDTATARVYIGDSYENWPGITVQIEGGSPVSINTAMTPFNFYELDGGQDVNHDGTITITITGSVFVIDGLDAVEGGPTNLPPAL